MLGNQYSGENSTFMYEENVQYDNFHKVLLIEDNPGDARLVELLLGESDLLRCKITNKTSLSDGMEALEVEGDYAAVLLDLTLPDSRGFETLDRLLEKFPDSNVIVLTGHSDKSLGIKAVQAGAQDFLVKGAFDTDLLAKSLRYSIERSTVLKRLEESQRIAHIGNWEYDPDTKKFTASDEAFRILGFAPRKTVINTEMLDDPNSPAHVFKAILEESQEQKVVKKDIKIAQEDGTDRHVFVQCTTTKNLQGRPVLNGIVQDVTEQKQAEELRKARDVARQSAKMKEQFIASISHEMRTPMNAILGMSNLLTKTEMKDEQKDYVSSIKQSSEILLGVINDILEISTLENGKINFEYKGFDFHELLTNLMNVMQYKKNEKDIKFVLEVADNVPQVIIGDKLRLNQVLYNLVGNAVKFTDTGFVKVSLKAEAEGEGKMRLFFRIQDTGIGIPKDKLNAIFDTFTRIRTKDRIFEGTGLGLSIAKNLVIKQNGHIGAESVLGEGSTFFFDMVFETSTVDVLEAEQKANEKEEVTLDPDKVIRLLLVEDHKMNQIVARKTLERQYGEKIKITIADDGQKAVNILEEQLFDIILMDIQMPIMDGYETTQYIRDKMPPEVARIPILAMTAHAHISKDEKFKEFGMDDYVLKPFEPSQLFSKIIQYVNRS